MTSMGKDLEREGRQRIHVQDLCGLGSVQG